MCASVSLFERLLGPAFAALPAPIQRLHNHRLARNDFAGRCTVERGRGRLAFLFAWAASLPAAGADLPVRVVLLREDCRETWLRDFAGQRLRSTLAERNGLLEETLGPVVFTFALHASERALEWTVAGVKVLGLPLPAAWFKGVTASESTQAEKYTFDVRAELPGVGLLVHYRGWLDVGQ